MYYNYNVIDRHNASRGLSATAELLIDRVVVVNFHNRDMTWFKR